MTRHPWLRWLTIAGAICIGLIVALGVILLLFQPTLNLSPLKHLLEEGLTHRAGVSVTLRELYLKTSLQPQVEVRRLQLAEVASFETTRLQIELIPLLRRRISIGSLELDQVTVQVRPLLGLVKDWAGKDDRPKSLFRIDALENLELDRARLNVTDDQGDSHRLVIDKLNGGISRTSPLELQASGNFDDVALQLEATGPTLEEFFAPAAALPLSAGLEIAGARVSAEGALTKQPSELALALDFTLGGDDLQATLAAAKVEVPSLDPFRLRGNLFHSGGPIQLSALEGNVGEANLSGDLQLSFENERFAVAGSLNSGRIDLQPWLESRPAEDASNEDPDQDLLELPLPAELVERVLAALDADVEVAIDGLDGLPTTVEELKAGLSIHKGRLNLPFELWLGSAPVEGQLGVASTQGLLEVAIDLSSSTLPLDRLAEDLGQGLATGTVGQVHLAASSSGTTVGDFINKVSVVLQTGEGQIRFRSPDNDRQVELVLTHMEVRRSPDAPLRAILEGNLHGYPYRIEMQGQDSKDWRSAEPWPFTLTAEGLEGRTRAEGRLTPAPGAFSLDLEFDSSGDRIGDLEPWWGVPAAADFPYRFQGRLYLEPDRRELRLDVLRIGQTTVTISLLVPQEEKAPIQVTLNAPTVALDELMHLIESTEDKDLASEDVLTIGIPIWTEEITLPDAKVHVELDRVLRDSEELADFSEVVADVVIRQSHLEGIAFSARADEARFRGQLDLDWRAAPPKMNLELGGEAADLGRLVTLDDVAPGLAVRADRFELQMTAAAQTLRQMLLEGGSISGMAEDVFLAVPLLDENDPLEVNLRQAEISESPNNPLQVTADGVIGEMPIDLDLRLRNKSRTGPDRYQLPVELSLRTGDVRLETRGDLTLPVSAKNLDLGFTLTADRISSFEPFLGHRISEVGPVAATGWITIRPENYSLEDLSLEVGESDVNGHVSLALPGGRPQLAADLSSHRIHLAELFPSPSTPDEGDADPAEAKVELDETSGEEDAESWLEKLESSKLASMDIDMNLQADDIYWGGDTGGGGELRANLEEGRFSAGPFSLALADGSVGGQVTILANDGLIAADLELAVDNVEYGPIVRYFEPESLGKGTVDLETRLATTSVPPDQLVTATTGDVRFAFFPHDLDTKILDLWGAGLLRSMFRLVDPGSESALNCMAGDFSVAEGQMMANNFWFDTSRIRAKGKGTINFDDMTINMTLRPRPKKRTFLSLATPAKIKGPLEDPSITLTKGGLVGTAFRLYMWTLTFYTQVFKKPLPTDGSDVCFLPPPPETVEPPTSQVTQAPGQ